MPTNEVPVIEMKIPSWEELPPIVKNGFEVVAKNEGFENYSFTIAPGSNVGDGFMSVMLKVVISGARVIDGTRKLNQTLQVICKMPPVSAERREMQMSKDAFRREIYIYTEYLPYLVEFQKSKGIAIEDQFFHFPKCYYGTIDENTGDAIIIMEDLREGKYSMYPKTKPMTYEYCRFVMEAFGKYHGLSLAIQKSNPARFDRFRYAVPDFMHLIMLDEPIQPMWDSGFGTSLSALGDSDEDKDVRERVLNLKANTREILLDFALNTGYPYSVITHGDAWINNFMFLHDVNGKPRQIVMLDWQIARYGSPVLDLTYFLFISTDKALRDKYWNQLIGLYYDTLTNTINQAGLDGRQVFPFEELQRQLKYYGRYGLLMSLMLVPFMQIPSNEMPDMDDSIKVMKEDGIEASGWMELLKPKDDGTQQRVADIFRDGKRLGMI